MQIGTVEDTISVDDIGEQLKPVTDEQVFYDKFYLFVCTRNFDNFFYDKCTCSKASSKASMLAFEQVHL